MFILLIENKYLVDKLLLMRFVIMQIIEIDNLITKIRHISTFYFKNVFYPLVKTFRISSVDGLVILLVAESKSPSAPLSY